MSWRNIRLLYESVRAKFAAPKSSQNSARPQRLRLTSERSFLESFWLWTERFAALLSIFASFVVVLGIESWLSERESRDLERSARIAEASAGAHAAMNDSRGHNFEIGQTDAFNLFVKLKRPVVSLDLDDITLNGVSLNEGVSQPAGVVTGFFNSSFVGDKSSPDDGCTGFAFDIPWIVLVNATIESKNVCLAGSAFIWDTNLAGKNIDISQSYWDISKVKGHTLTAAYRSLLALPKPTTWATDAVRENFEVSALEDVDLSRADIGADARYILIAGAKAKNASLYLNSPSIEIRDSVLTGAKLVAPSLLRISLRKDEEADLARVYLEFRKNGNESKIDQEEKTRREKQALVLEKLERMCRRRRSLCTGESETIAAAQPDTIYFSIFDSDIRGADLTDIPAPFLDLHNVCADGTTKLPVGAVVAHCGATLAKYWDKLQKSSSLPLIDGAQLIGVYDETSTIDDLQASVVGAITTRFELHHKVLPPANWFEWADRYGIGPQLGGPYGEPSTRIPPGGASYSGLPPKPNALLGDLISSPKLKSKNPRCSSRIHCGHVAPVKGWRRLKI